MQLYEGASTKAKVGKEKSDALDVKVVFDKGSVLSLFCLQF